MPTTWTKVTKAAGTTYTKVPSVSNKQKVANEGQPIGLLLALTYAFDQSIVTGWTDITKASGTSWTNITKAT